jgi:hypothetical protein
LLHAAGRVIGGVRRSGIRRQGKLDPDLAACCRSAARKEPLHAGRVGNITLDIDAKATILAAGNTERFIAMWSLKSFEKIFQLNALVGVPGNLRL